MNKNATAMTAKQATEKSFVMSRRWRMSLVAFLTVALLVTISGGKGSMKESAAVESNRAASPTAPASRFCLPNLITIPVGGIIGTATPYPSTINVSGMVGTVSSVTVTLNNYQHFWASDVDILLVSPDGRKFVVMSDVGGDQGFDNPATITLSDAATASLPASDGTPIPSGTYKPTNVGDDDEFPTPALPAPYNNPAPAGNATFASVFNGANPNGNWSLYIRDDSSGAGGSIAGGWCLDITTDAPLPGQLQFSLPGFYQVANNTATVTVNRVNGNLGAVAVNYATSNGTATGGASCGAGVDYVATSGTLTFANGESSKDFTVQLCPDNGPETDETVALTLSNPTGGASIGAQGTADLIIIPTSSAPATQFCIPTPIQIAGFGDAGAAFPYPSNITVSGLSGVISNVKVTLNGLRHSWSDDINILLVSPTGQRFVMMSDIGGSQGFDLTTTLTLTDFAATNLPVNSVPIASGAYKPTNVDTSDFFPAPAPASPYENPTPAGAATFGSVFNGFDPNGTWSLYVYDDFSGGSGIISDGWCLDITTTVPQAPGQLQFGTNNYATNEGETANVVVTRTGGSVGAVTVNYATSNGTATGGSSCTAGVDFISASGTLNFPDGVSSQTVPVQMCLDAENDPGETFNLTLSNPTGGATLGTNSTASVRIIHVDQSILRLYGSRFYGREGTTRTIVLTRNFNQIGTVTIDYATSSGTATGGASCTPGVDFINTSGTITFRPGEVERSFNITTCSDANFEEMELANITLSNAVGAQLSMPATATFNIFESVWQKQASFPTGQTLYDMHMISPTEGWAVGGYGVIIHTVDGGITWERQTSGTFETLNTVYFTDALHGSASGNDDLYTTDGGRTWLQAQRIFPSIGTVYQMTFADQNHGFATGNGVNAIMKTTDGGMTWFTQDFPLRVGLVKFFDPLNGIASSYQAVFVTSDGGVTWSQRPNATGGDEWFDTNRGWRINNSEVVNGLIRQKIDYTTDGGVTWTPGATPDGTFVFKLSFLDAQSGWGVGTKENIIRTSDGGLTWQTQRGGLNAPLKFSYPVEDVDMFDASRGVAVGNTGQVFTTSDGGATWTPRQTGGGYPVYKIVATDARRAWAGSYNGDLLYTTDGGKFWNRQRIAVGGSAQDALISGLAFPDSQNGWAGLRGVIGTPGGTGATILRTTNGGRDWQDVSNAPAHNCFALDTFDNQTIVSVGFDGAGAPIVRSTDGGQSWTYTRFPDSSVIRDVDMVSPNVGYAAAGVQLIKSTNGFATWTTVALSGSWFDVSFVDENNGWALAANDSGVVEVWHTANGGQSWDRKVMPDAVGVHAVNAQVAWIVEHDYDPNALDNATFALRTVDGGQTYTRELVSLDSVSTAVFFVDSDNGWIGGVDHQSPSLISDGAEIFRHGTLGFGNSANTPFDFDGDGKADISVFRPSNGTWYLSRSTQGFTSTQFGVATDKLVPADFDDDGKTDIAVFRDGNWYILGSSNNQLRTAQFGLSSDVPVPADYDGDGQADVAVFRPSNGTWYIQRSLDGRLVIHQFGVAEDKPTLGDFDGDSKADLAVFRPSTGSWYRLNSSDNQFISTAFGLSGDQPTPADYDGDGKTDISVFRPSSGIWYRLNSADNSLASVSFGVAEDKPVAADYDGDGKADVAVFRPANGSWYLLRSTAGFTSQAFGASEDLPAPNAFVR